MREFVLRAGSEATGYAGRARGCKMQPIFGLGEEDIKDTNRLLETLFDKLAADGGPPGPGLCPARSS